MLFGKRGQYQTMPQSNALCSCLSASRTDASCLCWDPGAGAAVWKPSLRWFLTQEAAKLIEGANEAGSKLVLYFRAASLLCASLAREGSAMWENTA